MPHAVRPATTEDIAGLVDLLMIDASERHTRDPILWKMAETALTQIEKALELALGADQQPFRQFWQVSEKAGKITGVSHAMLLPVPPIYAGARGGPGLILPDCCAAPDAPEGTVGALVAAAEIALAEAGARITLSSFVAGQEWQDVFAQRGYAPLTLYLSRTGLRDVGRPSGVRLATPEDVPGIVRRSAENRQVLSHIDPFWEAHPDADTRFAGWMARSLTLRDRDMLVMGPPDELTGYVIAQPASRLHFPPAHDIAGTGVVDDYYHPELADAEALADGGDGATKLLRAAERAFAERGMDAAFVVCPAGWRSKIAMLKAAGYETAMTWSIKH